MGGHGPARLPGVLALVLMLALSAPGLSEEQYGSDMEEPFHSLVWAWAQGDLLENKELGMCVGESEREKWESLQRTFPGKWPAKDSEDEFCADMNRGAVAICGREDLAFYSEVLLRTNNPEKIPTRDRCGTTEKVKGCWPGFFEFQNVTRPCCDGFFCPSMLTCMIPCPMGAYCTRAIPRAAPVEFADGDWCDPYAYKAKEGKCGGADFWSLEPRRGFIKGQWEYKEPGLFCPKGRYCTNTTSTPQICPKNHHCLQGSIKPKWCLPFVVKCEQGSDYPQGNFTGLMIVSFIFFGLLLFWQASKLCSLWSREKNAQSQKSEGFERHAGVGISSQATGSQRSHKALVHGSQSGLSYKQSSTSEEAHGICSRESPIIPDGLNLDPKKNLGDKELSTKRLGMFGKHSLDSEALSLSLSRIKIEFYGLSLQLKSSSKYILRSASGVLMHSQLTAIMGPSGAGKTSLLNSLSGKAAYGIVSGVVMMNGKKDKLEKYKRVMGFVPQDDIMHTDLTVEENLLFSAKYRLPAQTSHSSRMSTVERAIQVLGLNNVRHELIGNENTRGISGGERKRVNVGLELVADPLVLFLDEPTSGLDSSSCKQVVSALRTIAHLGVTTAAIVHQPSHRVMRLFDNLLLLGNMGSTVYNGPAQWMQGYFESLGFEFPSQANPIDVAMDIVTGQHRMQMNPDFQPYDLCILWIESNIIPKQFTDLELENRTNNASLQFFSQLKETFEVEVSDTSKASGKEWYRQSYAILNIASPRIQEFCNKTIGAVNECFEKAKGARVMERVTADVGQPSDIPLVQYHRRTPGFFPQFWWCLCRAILKKFRSPVQLFVENITFTAAGMALGHMTDMRHLENLLTFQKDSMYNFVAAGLLSSLVGLRAFGVSQNLYFRESASGINRLAYYLAVDTVGILSTTVHCLCYSLPYYYFMLPRTGFGRFYFIMVSMMFSWTGTAYITSQVMGISASQLTSAVLVLFHALLARPKRLDPGPRLWLRNALFTWWGSKAILLSEAGKMEGVWLLERCMMMMTMGFKINSFGHAMLVLISLGVLMRIAACVLLFTINRNKQK